MSFQIAELPAMPFPGWRSRTGATLLAVFMMMLRDFEGRHGNLLQIAVLSATPVTKAWLTPVKRVEFPAYSGSSR